MDDDFSQSAPDEAFDASDPKQVKKRKLSAEQRDRDGREVIAAILETPKGRNWMWNLLSRCHVFESSFSNDAMAMAFREGERNIGLSLLSEVTGASPGALVRMMQERGNA